MATAGGQPVCPVVGTTNTVLPPSHPRFDINVPGQVCPKTLATTDHHHNLQQHPPVPTSPTDDPNDASQCPALQKIVSRPEQQALDEAVCPVVGTVTNVLPPDHPSVEGKNEDAVCPVTNARLGHHEGRVVVHPPVQNASGVCPVVGKRA